MKLFRCAVIRADEAGEVNTSVIEALSECSGIEAFFCDEPPGFGDEVCAVVFISTPTNREKVLQKIVLVRSLAPAVAIQVVVANPKTEDLCALLTAGAYDFVSMPFVAQELTVRFKRAVGALPATDRTQRRPVCQTSIRGLIYTSDACAKVACKLPMMASCGANVLILGETGTGKEVCAHAIHYLSARAPKPWIAVNCGAIPAELMETELFGHVKGAYTTAHASRTGLVHDAETGTLFLDDIDCLTLSAQVKLLRFLQEREYRQVGSNTLLHADVRVIAASNCDLNALVLRGAFRQDLYYRLNVLRLDLPALRDRREDIAVLAPHFIHEFARDFQRQVSSLTPCAMLKLYAHDWPGNIRELKHVIERAVLLCSGPVLQTEDIQIDSAHQPEQSDDSFQSAKSRVVDNFERGYLERLLVAHGGNITRAAKAAKKDRRAFFELMRKHELEPESFRTSQV